jgi:predicted unusual protein kinase regulating ubiquinone biosynthesis (AarF/ABC1/UbiB family)
VPGWLLAGAEVWMAAPGVRAARLLEVLRRRGPAACMVARQFSWRIDLLPTAIATSLPELEDAIPAPAFDSMLPLIREAISGEPESVFRVFDLEPVSATTFRCCYQAELLDGTPVMVRVRPPGMAEAVAAEFRALGMILWTMELFTLVRPGTFRYLTVETEDLLEEEADMRPGARAQSIFRERLERDRISFLSAPEVYAQWLTGAVCVTGRVEGPTVEEILDVVEAAGEAGQAGAVAGVDGRIGVEGRVGARSAELALDRLRAMGIDPEKVAERIQQLAWWELLEGLFFHSEPTPADLVVLPGNRLVVTGFSDITVTSNRNRRLLHDLYRRLDLDDVSGAAEVLIQFLSPLPFVDIHALTRRVEARLWHHLFALRDPDAQWWERTSAGLWTALLDNTRSDGVPVHLDMIRMARSLLMYESMILRLDPGMKPLKEFRRHRRQADRRAARQFRKDGSRMGAGQVRAALVARVAEARSLFDRATFYLEALLQNLPISRLALPRKAAYLLIVALQHLTAAAVIGAPFIGAALLAQSQAGGPPDAKAALMNALEQPVYMLILSVVLVLAVRRAMFRLSDTE